MREKKVLLIFPPGFHPGQPYLALAQLKSWLNKNGIVSSIWDLNLEAYWHFLQPEVGRKNLTGAIDWLADLQQMEGLSRSEREVFPFLQYALNFGKDKLQHLPGLKERYRGEGFYRPQQYREMENLCRFFFRLACLPFRDTVFSFEVYHPRGIYDSEMMYHSVGSPQQNLLYNFLESRLRAVDENVSLVAINVTEKGQLHSALTLAYLLKKLNHPVHVTLGGSWITRLRNSVPVLEKFLDWVDSFCFFEGEQNLLALYRGLEKGNLCEVPNLLYRKEDGEVVFQQRQETPFCDHLSPDFSDLEGEEYFSADLVLPYQIMRGCGYGKCRFCEHSTFLGGRGAVRKKPSLKGLCGALRTLANENRCENFYFVDEMLSSGFLDHFSEQIIEEGLNMDWIGYARFEKDFLKNPQRILQWKKAGLRKLWMGLESTDDSMLQKMEKNQSRELMKKILQGFHEYDFPLHLFCLMGFPGETEDSVKRTVEDLISWKPFLQHEGFSLDLFCYTFARHSPAWEENIKGIDVHLRGDLDIACNEWKLENGLSSRWLKDYISEAKKEICSVYDEGEESLLSMGILQDSTHLLYLKKGVFGENKRGSNMRYLRERE